MLRLGHMVQCTLLKYQDGFTTVLGEATIEAIELLCGNWKKKLDQTNSSSLLQYALSTIDLASWSWSRSHILPILIGYGIDGFAAGVKPCLDDLISAKGNSSSINQMINCKHFY